MLPLDELDERALDLATALALEGSRATLSRSRWHELGKEVGIRDDRGRQLSTKELQPIAQRLVALKVVQERDHPSGSGYSILPDTAMRLLEHALATGRLDSMLAALDAKAAKMPWRGRRLPTATELRIALLSGDAPAVLELAQRMAPGTGREAGAWLVGALGSLPDPQWVVTLPNALVLAYLDAMLDAAIFTLAPVRPELEDLAANIGDRKTRMRLVRLAAMRGDPEVPIEPKAVPKWGAEGAELLRAFFRGEYEHAAAVGDAACRSMTSRRYKVLSDLEGVCHLLASAVCARSDPQRIDAIGEVLAVAPRDDHLREAWEPLFGIYRALSGEGTDGRPMCLNVAALEGAWTRAMLQMLHDLWLHPSEDGPQRTIVQLRELVSRNALAMAQAWEARATRGGYAPIARELSAIAAALTGEAVPAGRLAVAFSAPEAWETALSRLEALAETTASAEASGATCLHWELEVLRWGVHVKPRHREGPRARKGTAFTDDRLFDALESDSLDVHDRRAASAYLGGLVTDAYGAFDHGDELGSGRVRPGYAIVAALVGHPRVVDGSGAPITVQRGTPVLRTRRVDDGTRVEFAPPELVELPIVVEEAAPGRLVVYERGSKLEPLVQILAHGGGVNVPDAATDRLTRALLRVAVAAGIEVQGDVSVEADTVAADGRIVLQLAWNGATLQVRASVAPLGLSGPHVRPGTGATTIVGEIHDDATNEPVAGQFRRCLRDLKAEQVAMSAVLDACPTLASFSAGDLSWSTSSLADALQILVELDAHVAAHEDAAVLAWEPGKRLLPPRMVDLDALQLEVSGRKDWLDLDAKLTVDEETVIGFRALLAAREGPRFVALGRDRFIALSEALRRQLDALADLGSLKDDELSVPAVALSRLQEVLDDAEDVAWDPDAKDKIDRLRKAAERNPRVPRSLGATLRPYQQEGFVWMSRLASAGLGACLADDMGLGKTVQSIAILCERATLGPALVVCPTSVVGNWRQEIDRFAPGLRPTILATATDRAALLAGLRTRDVVLCSYSLMTSEADALVEIDFATVVFDEAHALKNEQTARATTARELKAGFRLGLTGTPVENRVTELWSLFAVLVPGLLGGKSRFESRFGQAVGRGDRERASHLRALLRPFVLRRTKAQVLEELPPRTEVTIEIEPSATERDFYEAVRRRAVEKVEQGDPQKKRMRILAQITKLRQAAIDPRLVDPVAPPGAKVEALARKLVDLRDEGHRALVFTQFLGSMAAVRERLAKDGVELLELDGSTPAAERSRRIEAFQAGEADVFLLSLRAGGTGINLTAADYVFHLDPWWNPAVEDQATDRAHRIGQTRPVTVYRMVTRGTIEEKILALHASKRQLAEDVLDGMEGTGGLDLDELAALLEA